MKNLCYYEIEGDDIQKGRILGILDGVANH
jgi:hypothetical protein